MILIISWRNKRQSVERKVHENRKKLMMSRRSKMQAGEDTGRIENL